MVRPNVVIEELFFYFNSVCICFVTFYYICIYIFCTYTSIVVITTKMFVLRSLYHSYV